MPACLAPQHGGLRPWVQKRCAVRSQGRAGWQQSLSHGLRNRTDGAPRCGGPQGLVCRARLCASYVPALADERATRRQACLPSWLRCGRAPAKRGRSAWGAGQPVQGNEGRVCGPPAPGAGALCRPAASGFRGSLGPRAGARLPVSGLPGARGYPVRGRQLRTPRSRANAHTRLIPPRLLFLLACLGGRSGRLPIEAPSSRAALACIRRLAPGHARRVGESTWQIQQPFRLQRPGQSRSISMCWSSVQASPAWARAIT